jgi:hypothetical protein
MSAPVGMPRGRRGWLRLVTEDAPRVLAPAPHERRATLQRRIDLAVWVCLAAGLMLWAWEAFR